MESKVQVAEVRSVIGATPVSLIIEPSASVDLASD